MRLSPDDMFLLSQCAVSAAYQAGQIIAKYSQRQVDVLTKQGGTSLAAQVVTEVDHLSQEVILKTLMPTCRIFDLALLSEESPDDKQRLHKDFFWSIDPLDGTLPFIESVPGYSVSIALVSREGIPLIGVVYDPLTQTLYQAVKDRGASRNGAVLKPTETQHELQAPLTFITDKSFAEDPLYQETITGLNRIANNLGYADVDIRLQGGAAMNACQALEIPNACYVKFPKPQQGGGSIWDYAATACLFEEVGASVSDIHGNPLVLNPDGSTFMNHCGVVYCAAPKLSGQIVRLYQRLSARSIHVKNIENS